jgi:hypothetical protein
MFTQYKKKMGAVPETIRENVMMVIHPIVEQFILWFMAGLNALVEHVILPMQQVVQEKSAPVLEYVYNQTNWIIPMLFVGFCGPALMTMLQCILVIGFIVLQCVRCFSKV